MPGHPRGGDPPSELGRADSRRWPRDPAVLFQAIGYLGRLTLRRAACRYGQIVTAIHGRDRVEGVTIQEVDASWRPRPGTEQVLEADGVCLGFGFVPQLDLAQLVGCDIRYDRARGELSLVTDDGCEPQGWGSTRRAR